MHFNYEDYRQYLKYLAVDDQKPFQELMSEPHIVEHLLNNPRSKNTLRNLEIQPGVCLEYILVDQFFDPLIEKLEKSTEDTKKDDKDFSDMLNRLKIERDKKLNEIRRMNSGEKPKFQDFKGVINASLADSGHSFAYHSFPELQDIVESMAKIYQTEGSLPCTFEITPDRTEYSGTSDEFKYKQITESVLAGAAKAGLKPEQVNIMINGVKQTPENNAAYQAFIKEANKKIEEKVSIAFPRR